MPYRYVLKWKKGEDESLAVEAWPKAKHLAGTRERRRPSFVIGKVNGTRSLAVHQLAMEASRKYPNVRRRETLIVKFPPDDITAIADAFRVGLAAAVADGSESAVAAEVGLRYVQHAPQEEVWFWASKMLRVLGEGTDSSIVIRSLCVLAGGLHSKSEEYLPLTSTSSPFTLRKMR